MRKVREILRLRIGIGLSTRQVADSCKVSTSTVHDARPTELPAVRSFWVAQNMSDGDNMQCILCGRTGPVDRVSPIAIKGLTRIGGQSSGMALVSANNDAFLSYGAKQALIAPTCRSCGEAYANSTNYMLGNEAYRVFVGPTAFLFWTSEEVSFNPAALIRESGRRLLPELHRPSGGGED